MFVVGGLGPAFDRRKHPLLVGLTFEGINRGEHASPKTYAKLAAVGPQFYSLRFDLAGQRDRSW